ncbi:hypothetical protein [Halosolutus gelatinilyticus]|uniref:hypothetical protein n=1 Tax=Halosolutus gelatinilyticus TaxID=2931975 RepID=UPI001FF54B0F|nr:hypothetical protein [Halosolutus gelatinilyticus]
MTHARSESSSLVERGLLALGFLALAGAAVTAHTSPASGYELSLYTSTPRLFWALFAAAVMLSLIVAVRSRGDWNRRFALGLAGGAIAVFAGLPVLRGYRFYGAGDALTHLGWMRGIRSGAFAPTELPYPALHTVATVLSVTVGIDLTQAALLVIVVLTSLFFCFVTLSAATVFDSRYSLAIGAFSALLFLPITTLSTFMVPHAMSQAILFSSFAVFLLLKYVLDPALIRRSSALGALFALTLVALVFYHPQLAAHLLVAFLGICVLQYLVRRYRTDHPIATHRPIYGQTALILVAFLAWISNHGFIIDSVGYAASSAAQYFIGGGNAGASVDSQSTSLGQLGASVAELVLKLFGPSLVFIALAGLLVLWTLWRFDGSVTRKTNGLIPYFTVSLVGMTGLFVVYFIGSYSQMYFRVLGLMLLLATVVGAVTIAYTMSSAAAASGRVATGALHGVVVVGFVFLLLFSLLAVFPSPYIYNSSPHVTEMSMEGHETAFENQAENVTFLGIRAGPNRYADAFSGEKERTRIHQGVESEEIDDGLPSQFSDDRYLTVTQSDRDRELRSYQGLRYSEEQFNDIPRQQGVDRVQSNGEFELYYVHAADT